MVSKPLINMHGRTELSLARSFSWGALLACLAVLPAGAGPITWVFSGTGANGGIQFTDGSSLTGSFVYNAGVNCTESDCTPENDVADFGLFTSLSVNVTGVAVVSGHTIGKSGTSSGSGSAGGTIPTGVTWYINTDSVDTNSPGGDCCADSLDVWLVDANPTLAANADLTDVGGHSGPGGNPAFEIELVLEAPMTGAGGVIEIVPGSVAGVCATPGCGDVFVTGSTTLESGQYLDDPEPVPEPGSLLLFGSGLLTFGGVLRRKVA